jgi:hypothetical protein
MQGMNDLFMPIILTYFLDWNADTGDPIDPSGKPIDVHSHILMISSGRKVHAPTWFDEGAQNFHR